MTVEEAFPKELTNVLDSPEFDNEAGIMMESAQFTEYGMDFRFSIRFYEDTPSKNCGLAMLETLLIRNV